MNHQFISSEEKQKEIFQNCKWKFTKQRSVLVQNIFNGPNTHFCVNTINEELKNNKIAVCYLNGEFTVKRVKIEKDHIYLIPENKMYDPIKVTEENEFIVWGIVTYVVKKI